MSYKGDFSFHPKNGITLYGSSTIRIGPWFTSGSTQPFSTRKENEIVPHEALNLRGQIRLPRTPRDEAENIVSYEQVTLANYRQPEDFTILLSKVDNSIT